MQASSWWLLRSTFDAQSGRLGSVIEAAFGAVNRASRQGNVAGGVIAGPIAAEMDEVLMSVDVLGAENAR